MRGLPVLVGLLALLAAASAKAQTPEAITHLSVPQAREAGLAAMQNQRPDVALKIARALLAADPQDPFGHFLMASALTAMNQLPLAQVAGKLAFKTAQTPEQKFQAARATALAAYGQQRFGSAQWWLRRAITAAPDSTRRARSIDEFKAVRAKNPMNVTLSFAAAPSDNVNNGSSDAFNIIDGVPIVGVLSADAQRLSGVSFDGSVDLRYRLRKTANTSTSLGFTASFHDASLSANAKQRLGAIPEPELGARQVEVSLRQSYIPQGKSQAFSFGVTLGRRWQNTVEALDFGRLSLGYSVALGTQTLFDTSISAEQRSGTQRVPQGDKVVTLRGGLTRQIQGAGFVSATVYSGIYDTARAGQSSATVGFQLGFDLAKDLGPLRLSANLGLQSVQFDGYTLAGIVVPGGRHDQRAVVEMQMLFPKIEMAGFAPQLSLRQQVTQSNVSRFDSDETALTLEIKSSF